MFTVQPTFMYRRTVTCAEEAAVVFVEGKMSEQTDSEKTSAGGGGWRAAGVMTKEETLVWTLKESPECSRGRKNAQKT